MSELRKEGSPARKAEKAGAAGKDGERQAGTVMYVGPTIKGVAVNGTLYRNGLPEALEAEAARQPAIRSLVVPVGELAAAQRELAVPGSALAVIYGRIVTG